MASPAHHVKHCPVMKKQIGRPNEERRARQLLERIARKTAAPKKVAEDRPKALAPVAEAPKQS